MTRIGAPRSRIQVPSSRIRWLYSTISDLLAEVDEVSAIFSWKSGQKLAPSPAPNKGILENFCSGRGLGVGCTQASQLAFVNGYVAFVGYTEIHATNCLFVSSGFWVKEVVFASESYYWVFLYEESVLKILRILFKDRTGKFSREFKLKLEFWENSKIALLLLS